MRRMHPCMRLCFLFLFCWVLLVCSIHCFQYILLVGKFFIFYFFEREREGSVKDLERDSFKLYLLKIIILYKILVYLFNIIIYIMHIFYGGYQTVQKKCVYCAYFSANEILCKEVIINL